MARSARAFGLTAAEATAIRADIARLRHEEAQHRRTLARVTRAVAPERARRARRRPAPGVCPFCGAPTPHDRAGMRRHYIRRMQRFNAKYYLNTVTDAAARGRATRRARCAERAWQTFVALAPRAAHVLGRDEVLRRWTAFSRRGHGRTNARWAAYVRKTYSPEARRVVRLRPGPGGATAAATSGA